MRIGILTQPLLNNYGGLLQNYALQRVLIDQGHTPITIDQKPIEYPKWREYLGRFKGCVMHSINPIKYSKPKYILTSEEKAFIERNTRQFINTHIIHSNKCAGEDDFKRETIRQGIEGFIVGSDQCWRPKYNAYIEDMFLSFSESLPIKRRIAYAASFGTDLWEFSPELTENCAKLAKKFDLITVREDSGVELCRRHLGVKSYHVLDPTMLLQKEDYIEIINQEGVKPSPGTLYNYILDPTDEVLSFIKEIETSLSLKSFQVLPDYNEDHRTRKNVKNSIEKCVYPSPIEWLRAFMNAEMTIVDSFHGMVFSILFNKPFWVIGNPERGMSRFISLLRLFDLEDRLVSTKNLSGINIKKTINWDKVNELLKVKRDESLNYLISVLE